MRQAFLQSISRGAAVAAVLALFALPGAARAETPADRQAILEGVDRAAPGITADAMEIWDLAEVGYAETRSSAVLQKRLKDAGFKVEPGVANMPTAFVATFDNGPGPVIGFLAEYDALPGLSQKAVGQKEAAPGRNNGHGCGHNLFGAASAGSAIAVAQWMKSKGVKGQIRVFGTPAEELGTGKINMASAGLFDNVSVALHWHPGNSNSASQSRWLATMSGKFRFRGQSAHAAAAPSRGRSALDGVQLMNMAVEFMREHVPDGTRIHYAITDGGKVPNVIPDFAEVYYFVRNVDPKVVQDTWKRVRKAAEGAALATDTTHDVEVIGGTYSMLPNDTLGRVMDEKLRSLGGISLDPAETAFANEIRASFSGEIPPLDSVEKVEAYDFNSIVPASSDVSDVSWITPTVGLFTASFVPGSPGHSWQTSASAGTTLGTKSAVLAAKAMALTAADALTSPELITKARAELEASRGKGFRYSTMLQQSEMAK